MDISRLLEEAQGAKAKAYAPYSGFRVGAALLTGKNRVFTGCNIENASFGLTVCAERVAVYNAVSSGEKDFRALAVIGDGEDCCRPCGACRQVLAEFGGNILIIMANKEKQYEVKPIFELLPEGFNF